MASCIHSRLDQFVAIAVRTSYFCKMLLYGVCFYLDQIKLGNAIIKMSHFN